MSINKVKNKPCCICTKITKLLSRIRPIYASMPRDIHNVLILHPLVSFTISKLGMRLILRLFLDSPDNILGQEILI